VCPDEKKKKCGHSTFCGRPGLGLWGDEGRDSSDTASASEYQRFSALPLRLRFVSLYNWPPCEALRAFT